MSPRRVCKLEKFKGKDGNPECAEAIPENKPKKDFCTEAHRVRFWYLENRRRRRRKRNSGPSNPLTTPPTRVRSRRYVEVGSIRKGLELAARLNPDFILKLAASIREPEKVAAD